MDTGAEQTADWAYDPANNTLYFIGGDAQSGGYFDLTAHGRRVHAIMLAGRSIRSFDS